MKKTFTSLFLLSLLTVFGSLSVKADPIVKYFGYHDGEWTQNGNVAQPAECCAGYIEASDKIVTGSDFYYSGKHQVAVERDGDNWTGFNGSNGTVKACTRAAVSLSASTTYTFSLLTKDKGEMNITLPKISIDGTNYVEPQKVLVNSVEQSFSNNQYRYTNNEETVLEYSITAPSSSSYTVSFQFTSGYRDKFKASTLTITPNCTQHTVTVAADDNNKGTVAGGGSYCENSEVTVTATPNAGYNFVNWTDNNNSNAEVSTNASYTFTLTANVSYRANFAACEGAAVTVNKNNNDYGTVTGAGSYCPGDQVDIEATPNSGYRFVEWEVTSGSATLDDVHSASTHFTMSNPAAAVTVQANFEVDPCTNSKTIQCEDYDPEITKPSVGHAKPGNYQVQGERIDGSDGGYGAAYGDAFASFRDSGNDKEIFYNIYLPAATYTFTVRCANGGLKKVVLYNAAGDEKLQELELGNEWTNNSWYNYTTSSWTASSSDNYYIGLRAEGQWAVFDQITITANSNVFCPNTITMQKSGDDGAAAPTAQVNSSNVTTAFEGAVVTVMADEPSDANHYFSGWTVSPENAVTFDAPASPTTTFVMPAEDVTITANYGAVVSSKFTYTTSGSGSITCATPSDSNVNSGTTISMTAVPSDDYVFTGWTATAGTFSNAATLTTTFTMPSTAAEVTANFAQVDNKIITGTSATVIESNGSATLTVTSVSDFDAFNHNVLKFAYSDMEDKYKGQKVAIDAGYSPASSAGATGFGFYYKTEKADDNVAFCFEVSSGQQVKWELQATNNVWKYYYFAHPEAAGWAHSGIFIYMNGDDGGNHTTYKNSGAFYMSEIAATTITSKPDMANYHYTNNRGEAMQVGEYGTLCLPMDGTISGATLYSVAGKEESDNTYLVLDEEEGNTIEAGKPYITQSTATSYTVTMNGPHSAVQNGNGLVGTYETIDLTPYAEPGTLNYILYDNAFRKAGNNVTVGAYRAYLNWDEVNDAPAPAPSARRIRMVIEGKEAQTGMETVTAMPKTTKVLIDGQLFIIREGKRYTLTGARAQ